jgi:glutathione S-transferase
LDAHGHPPHRERMKLYFSPLACSLASRITAYETGADIQFIEVDPDLPDGGHAQLRAVNPLAQVPALVLDDGRVITENAAVLQYLGDGVLVPRDRDERTRLHEWLSFIGTELHKTVYVPLLDKKANDGAKAYALSKAPARIAALAAWLDGRAFALSEFSVADAYLVAVTNWSTVTPVELPPPVVAYRARMHERPSVRRAMAEEYPMYAGRNNALVQRTFQKAGS